MPVTQENVITVVRSRKGLRGEGAVPFKFQASILVTIKVLVKFQGSVLAKIKKSVDEIPSINIS